MEYKNYGGITPELPMKFHKVFVVWLLIGAVISVPNALFNVCYVLSNFSILTEAFAITPFATTMYIIAIVLTCALVPLRIKTHTAMSEFQYKGISLFKQLLVLVIMANTFSRCPWDSEFTSVFGYLSGAFISLLIYYIPLSIYYKKRAYLFNPPENLKDKAYNDYIVAVEKYKVRNSSVESTPKPVSSMLNTTNETKSQNSSCPDEYLSTLPCSNTQNSTLSSDKNKTVKIKINPKSRTSVIPSNKEETIKNSSSAQTNYARNSEIRFCRKCGQKLVIDSLYCSNCGNKVIPEDK